MLHAGVSGVAYPSLIARAFSAVVILCLCFGSPRGAKRALPDGRQRGRKSSEGREGMAGSPVRVRLKWKNIFRREGSMVRRILGIAVPNGIENGLFQLVKIALSSITALFGTVQIAANGVAQSFWSVAALMGTALILLAAPLVLKGYALSDEAADLVVLLVVIHNIFNALFYLFSGALANGCGPREMSNIRCM